MSGRTEWKVLRNALSTLDILADEFGYEIEWEIKRKGEGTNKMEIEIKEGETMVEALTRIAKEQAKTTEPVREVVPKQNGGSKSPRKAVKPNNVTLMAAGAEVDEGKSSERDIYSTVHVYRREGETEGKVRWNGNHEREMHGPGTLVYVHLHKFGADCDSSCKVKVEAE